MTTISTTHPTESQTIPAVGDTVIIHVEDPQYAPDQEFDGKTGRVFFVAEPVSDWSHPIFVVFPDSPADLRFKLSEVEIASAL